MRISRENLYRVKVSTSGGVSERHQYADIPYCNIRRLLPPKEY